jgi:ABC-2 type transport system ATP-binding protein/lipopolysaccharide transport system ATP-binding protein
MTIISVQNVSVDIPIYDAAGGSIRKFLLGRAIGGQLAQQGSHVVVRALKDISFEAQDGDRIGLVGQNGSGKTTLLRVLCGTYPPSAGSVETRGRISPMLDNMLGMDGDATGFENIRICGLLRGMTSRQVEENMEDIVAFTELGDYLKMPVRSYSSGMLLRLAFAVATVPQAEILLIDESIGVGDEHFFQKAFTRLNDLVSRSRILVVASHAQHVIQKLCNKALWLDGGKIVAYDSVDRVLAAYGKRDPALLSQVAQEKALPTASVSDVETPA